MSPKTAGHLNIVLSIVFAIAILLSSYWMMGSENAQTVMFLLIALWWIPFSTLTVMCQKNRCCRYPTNCCEEVKHS